MACYDEHSSEQVCSEVDMSTRASEQLTEVSTEALAITSDRILLIRLAPSITLILSLPFLLFYAQSKSREVGNMWGYPVL